jgi:hypothetical protein
MADRLKMKIGFTKRLYWIAKIIFLFKILYSSAQKSKKVNVNKKITKEFV